MFPQQPAGVGSSRYLCHLRSFLGLGAVQQETEKPVANHTLACGKIGKPAYDHYHDTGGIAPENHTRSRR
ncbi:hypothetical protein ElyMa_003792200 [Elysia marginata]|uniref:Uncharacterized protein n=1 Tax=Elysia marginata TaxID=1093978 RepID=A0AAV4FBQ0_9GAST|nr:hypothetical protein ElyMa_003792200 [Elysia marginata]